MAAIGEAALVQGYALAGVAVTVATDPDDVRRAWDALDPQVTVVLATSSAAAALRGSAGPPGRMLAVLSADGEVPS
jgi:vacuolar-type H+-ATPase subunit F/Vma7